MGSGREGDSPSPVVARASSAAAATQGGGRAMSPSLLHKLQREELLEGGSMPLDLSQALPGATLRVSTSKLRSPRGGSTPLHSPLHSPHAMSPLHSPKAVPVDLSDLHFQATNILRGSSTPPLHSPQTLSPLHSPRAAPMEPPAVDFQEAILRAGHMRKSSSMPKSEVTQLPPQDDSPALPRRTRSDISDGRHNSGRFKVEVVPMEQEALAFPRNRKPDLAVATPEGLLDKGRSPRLAKAGVVEVQEAEGTPRSERKPSRSASTRRSKSEMQEVQEGDLGMGDANRASRRSHVRPHSTRQHKRKASDPVPTTTMPLSLPEEPYSVESQAPELYPPPYRTARCSAAAPFGATPKRAASRDASSAAEMSSDWVQVVADILMWRHIPRSALLFGVGCFCIVSTSVVRDMRCSAISVLAYIALLYLAVTFVKRTFLRGASFSSAQTITESDALKLIKVVLPLVNIVLSKLAGLFSGEPAVTLKLAAALWLLAQAGYVVNMWTLARFAYFALFIIPKFYSSYRHQMHGQARKLLHWVWSTWNACSHKKAVLFAAFVLAWNISSVSTRICGAFISIVALRVYQHVLSSELEKGNFSIFGGDKPSYGLELVTIPQAGFDRRP